MWEQFYDTLSHFKSVVEVFPHSDQGRSIQDISRVYVFSPDEFGSTRIFILLNLYI